MPRPETVIATRGGRTARENIADLCDGSFIEYGALARRAGPPPQQQT